MEKTRLQSKGFTLVEIIVVMSVFMLIVGVAVAIFLSIVANQRRILSQEQMLSQVSYAMEYMSKGLRMTSKDSNGNCLLYADNNQAVTETFPGYIYLYTRPDSQTNQFSGIKFINASDNYSCQEFYLYYDSETGNKALKELKNSLRDDHSSFLTSSKYNVDYLKYSINGGSGKEIEGVYGTSGLDNQQPRITVIMGFEVPGDDSQPEIKIQTTVSQRNLNATQ